MNYPNILTLATCWLFSLFSVTAQDTLILISGQAKPVSITQVNDDLGMIMFFDWMSPNQNIHSLSTNQIHEIRFNYGAVQRFSSLMPGARIGRPAPGNSRGDNSPAYFKLYDGRTIEAADFHWTGSHLSVKRNKYDKFKRWAQENITAVQVSTGEEYTLSMTRSGSGEGFGWVKFRNGSYVEVSKLAVTNQTLTYQERNAQRTSTKSLNTIQSILWPNSPFMLVLSPYNDIDPRESINTPEKTAPQQYNKITDYYYQTPQGGGGDNYFDGMPGGDDVDYFNGMPQNQGDDYDYFQGVPSGSGVTKPWESPGSGVTKPWGKVSGSGNPLQVQSVVKMRGRTKEIPAITWPLVDPSTSVTYSLTPPKRFGWDGWSLFKRRSSSYTIADAISKLESAFAENSLHDYAYFPMPDGVAVLTGFEKIYPDGKQKPLPEGLQTDFYLPAGLGFQDLPDMAQFAEPGRYRMILLAISTQPPHRLQSYYSGTKANSLGHVLPRQLEEIELTDEHKFHVLVYEWVQVNRKGPADFAGEDTFGVEASGHFQSSGLAEAIKEAE